MKCFFLLKPIDMNQNHISQSMVKLTLIVYHWISHYKYKKESSF